MSIDFGVYFEFVCVYSENNGFFFLFLFFSVSKFYLARVNGMYILIFTGENSCCEELEVESIVYSGAGKWMYAELSLHTSLDAEVTG